VRNLLQSKVLVKRQVISQSLVISTIDKTSARVGRKAAALGELRARGLPVPAGFCVTLKSMARLDRAWVRQAIERALVDLGAPRLAVRSSAVAEDADDASCAGVYETRLNVPAIRVFEALSGVRASASTARAKAYLGESRAGLIAAIVQRMLVATSSGVAATRDPLTNRPRMVVEAALGLGQGLVAGLVTPDRYVVSEDGTLLETQLALKEVTVVGAAAGGTELVRTEPARARAPTLDPTAVVEVASLAARCEDILGSPQVIEWAFAEGRLWLLQSRPITGLSALPRSRG
jgi:phosphoenolpyruvate synthase/pyruvate phosphate dikinase